MLALFRCVAKAMFCVMLGTPLIGGTAMAAYLGPTDEENLVTVRDVLSATSLDEDEFCLDGHIINKVATHRIKYTFTDGKDEIKVRILTFMLDNVDIKPSTKVRVCGNVNRELVESNELNVRYIQVLP